MFIVKNFLYTLFVAIVSLMVQGSVLRAYLPDFAIPSLLLPLIVFISFYENSASGAVLAFLIGLLFDLYSGNQIVIGPMAGTFVATFCVLAMLSQRMFVESTFAVIVITALAALFNAILYKSLTYNVSDSYFMVISFAIVTSVVTALVTPLLFRIYKFILLRKRSHILSINRVM